MVAHPFGGFGLTPTREPTLEIRDGIIDTTSLGPESWLGVGLGTWILLVSLLSLLFLIVHVFPKRDWYERFNNNALLQRRLLYITAPLFVLVAGYAIYVPVLEVVSGVREFGFVWILQGVLVFAAVGFFSAKGSLLLWKPVDECTHHPRNLRQRYVDVFRDGLEFGIVGLLVGLATGDRAAADDAAFGFGILGIILSIMGEVIRCLRRRNPKPPRGHRQSQ